MSVQKVAELPAIASELPASFSVTHWRLAATVLFSSLLLVSVGFRSTISAMVEVWRSNPTFSHGFLVLPIALYMVWFRRKQLVRVSPAPNFWGLLPVVLFVTLWFAGYLGSVRLVEELAFVGMLVAIAFTILGRVATRVMLLPLLFLFFAVPFGESLISPLQDYTAWFTVGALRLSHVPVVLVSRTIYEPSGTWEVAEACSGVRYLLSSVMLGACLCFFALRSWRRRVTVMAASVVVPVITNGLRAYGIVLLGHLTDNNLARGADHIIYGWLFLSFVSFILVMITLHWQEPTNGTATGNSEITLSSRSVKFGTSVRLHRFVLAGLLVLSAVAIALFWTARDAARPNGNLTAIAWPVTAPWHPVEGATEGWMPRAAFPLAQVSQRYLAEDRCVDLSVVYYSTQKGGVEALGPFTLVSDPRLWSRERIDSTDATVDGTRLRVVQVLLRTGNTRRLVWSWYWVGGEQTANSFRAKFLQAKSRLFSGPTAAAVIAISSGFADNSDDARAALQDFLLHSHVGAALAVATTRRKEI
jgi:exosortase A